MSCARCSSTGFSALKSGATLTKVDCPDCVGARRWAVAVHEAAHKVVAEKLGWSVRSVRIIRGGDEGVTDDRRPWFRDTARVTVEDAVIALAGVQASLREASGPEPYGLEHDRAHAAKVLRSSGTSVREAEAQARLLVGQNWNRILATATKLYLASQPEMKEPSRVAQHEAGHAAAAKLVGAPISRATTGGFFVGARVSLANPETLSSRDYIAFMMTPRFVTGHGPECDGDDANIRAELTRIPEKDCAATMRAAEADARRYATSPLVEEYAAKLARDGRL